MKSNLISKSETSAVLKTVSESWGIECPKLKNLKVHQISDEAQIFTGKGIKILKIHNDYLPFLYEIDTLEDLKRIEKKIKSSTTDFLFL